MSDYVKPGDDFPPPVKLKSWENFLEWEMSLIKYSELVGADWVFKGLMCPRRDRTSGAGLDMMRRLDGNSAKWLVLQSIDECPFLKNRWTLSSLPTTSWVLEDVFCWEVTLMEISEAVMKDWGKTKEDLYGDLCSLVAEGAESFNVLLSKMERISTILNKASEEVNDFMVKLMVFSAVKRNYPHYLKDVQEAVERCPDHEKVFYDRFPFSWVNDQIRALEDRMAILHGSSSPESSNSKSRKRPDVTTIFQPYSAATSKKKQCNSSTRSKETGTVRFWFPSDYGSDCESIIPSEVESDYESNPPSEIDADED